MNIFILDEDLDKCAEYHIDKHIVKMPLEAAQMLCTTHWVDTYLGYVPRKLCKEELAHLRKCKHPENVSYAVAMANHPCTIWTSSSLDNYEWLFCYALALNDEYGYRYGKSHKSIVATLERFCGIGTGNSGEIAVRSLWNHSCGPKLQIHTKIIESLPGVKDPLPTMLQDPGC